MHFKTAQEAGEDLGPMSIEGIKSNIVAFVRKKQCVEVNRIAAEQVVLSCSDEDLAALCRDLGAEVIRKREEYFTALEAQAKALSEKSRRAGRG